MTNTLSTSNTIGITLTANGAYQSPFTITGTGTVSQSTYSAIAVYGSSATETLVLYNTGKITGGVGSAFNGSFGGAGGSGVALSGTVSLDNTGDILGGAGGYGVYGGGAGGTGVVLSGDASMSNGGAITGGAGSYSLDNGGAGGLGVDLSGMITLSNGGAITGGAGGNGGSTYGGAGGAGLYVSGTLLLDNTGEIAGGAGGAGVSGNGGGLGIVSSGTISLSNAGTITGGIAGIGGGAKGASGVDLSGTVSLGNTGRIGGGAGGSGVPGGSGGAGAALAGTITVNNDGSITGGIGGFALVGGAGGLGATLAGEIALNNQGGIAGGAGSSGGASGVGGSGVVLFGTGSVSNTGSITGGAGGYAYGSTAGDGGAGVNSSGAIAVSNGGSIVGGNGGKGAKGVAGGAGGAGVYLNGGILVDRGLIAGGVGGTGATTGVAGNAVQFGTAVGTLVVEAGASFVGIVAADAAVADVLGLGGTVGVDVAGIGSEFTGFAEISFAAGATATAAGTYTAFDAGQIIGGFASHDTLVLDGFAANPVDTTYVQGVGLELTSSTGGAITLDIAGSFSTGEFTVTDPAAVTTITVNPCFCAGTRILLGRGEVAIEALAVGDELVLADGGLAPIRWIGHRRIEVGRHADPERVLPVVIEAGALADFVPQRALYLSPDHALYLGGYLIPAKALINGATIHQVWRERVVYYHVELAAHGVLLAEGTPAESYLESGNRGAFTNGGAAIVLHPDFAQAMREASGCAPFAESGAVVEAVRAGILARAAIPMTGDADVAIRYRPDGAAVIESRTAIPGNLTPDPRDRRRLGVKITAIRCGGRRIALDDPALMEGWHGVETDGRWTDGAAVVPGHLVGGEAVRLTVAGGMRYPVVGNRLGREKARGAAPGPR